MACVYIPVQNSEEEVRVALDQLPRDASDILDILKAEQAPLDLWLIIAVRSTLYNYNATYLDFSSSHLVILCDAQSCTQNWVCFFVTNTYLEAFE
ncbi:Tetratricopeptide TPR-1 [Cucumis melo var. makuwa]|uniref:Tetratricopeptide TPR-1 n=1 Tax=Cucumis melo var. makuwa TaxID=1194695 RepID=A0A5A7UL36_CUCMM|nr:Tetratricopeptide TPR-1 [Cucumis melo var. makuwa]